MKYLFLVLFFTTCINAKTNNLLNDLDSIYEIGSIRYFKIKSPKYGFLGCPPNASSKPNLKVPKKEEHYDVGYLQTIIIEKRDFKSKKRIVIQCDEIDTNKNILKKGMFYWYVDIDSFKVAIIWSYEDDNPNYPETGFKSGIVFPFNCCMSPFYLDKKSVKFEKKFFSRKYTIEKKKGQKGFINLYAEYFRSYQPENGEKVFGISWTENQYWNKKKDWVFKKSERFNKRGFKSLECIQIE